jgi:transportin-3
LSEKTFTGLMWWLGALENLEVMLSVIRTFGEELPAACQNTCQEAWVCLDLFIDKYGSGYEASDRVTRLLRHGLTFFGSSALPITPSVLSRMTSTFEATGLSGYVWVVGKIVEAFGNSEDLAVRAAFKAAYLRISNKVLSLLQEKSPGGIPDGKMNVLLYVEHLTHQKVPPSVLEDYMQMLSTVLEYTPDIFFETPSAFPIAFRAALVALTLIQSDLIFASLDLILNIVTHDCLTTQPGTIPPPKFPTYAAVIRGVVEKEGFELVSFLITGLVGEFPEDSTSTVITIFRMLASVWSGPLLSWLPPVLQQLSTTAVSDQTKSQFMAEVTRHVFQFLVKIFFLREFICSAINAREWDKVKYGILTLHRTSLKARDRRRATLDR